MRPVSRRDVSSSRARVAGVLISGTVAVALATSGAGVSAASVAAAAPVPTADDTVILVRPAAAGPPVAPQLTGVNNDQWFENSHGLWDPQADAPNPRVVEKTAAAGVKLVRYPGGTPATFFDWRRAVGPTADRGCQTDGRPGNGSPRDSVYGPDEHLEFVTAAGAEASIMVPFVKGTPQSAADWVEYLNAAVGTNPGGGRAWADVRAANGHPKPWGVTRWEVGNEHDRPDQRYWMSPDSGTAMRQYAFGGTQRQVGQRLGRGCDFRSGLASDGRASQRLSVPYPPVGPDTQTVRVDGNLWQEVSDLSGSGPGDRVYLIDDASGTVTFGDGTHGAVPRAGAAVTADYDSGPHAGFVDVHRAMKAVDPKIDVCATWAPISEDTGLGGESLPDLLSAAGATAALECLVVHPYTNFRREFGDTVSTARQLHDWHMLGEANATATLRHHAAEVDTATRGQGYTTTSELGALFFGTNDTSAYRSWNTAMSHATYFASQWARLADLGVPWAEANTLISETPTGLRAVLGGSPDLVETSEHVVRTALRGFVEGGGVVIDHQVKENPVVPTEATDGGSAYDALVVTASRGADGHLRIVVVNRDPERDHAAQVVPAGFPHGPAADLTTVQGANTDPDRESFESHNSLDHPAEVTATSESRRVGPGSFALTFPRHSMTILRLAPR